MPRRKYTRGKEEPKGWECCNKKCKWQGQDEDKGERKVDSSHTVIICPKCGKDEFYGLLEKPVIKVELAKHVTHINEYNDFPSEEDYKTLKALWERKGSNRNSI